MKVEVDTSRLYSHDTAEYIGKTNRWIKSGFRLALELLELELPDFAAKQPAGRRRSIDVVRDYHADNPVEAIKDQREKLEAGNEASKAAQAERLAAAQAKADSSGRDILDIIG